MRIIYMGTPDFSVGALEALIEAGHEILLVVTQPDKPKGRGGKKQEGLMQFSPVKECAIAHGIPVFQPTRIRKPEAVAVLKEYDAEVYVVAAFGQILSQEVLDIPPRGCINIHASLLPKYRGASPIQQAILDGEEKTGVTIMQMDIGVDTGDILYQKELPIVSTETGESLFEKLAGLGAKTIVEALALLEQGKLSPIPQDETKATHVAMLEKAQGLLDFSESAVVLERKVRGLNSWPSAYTFWHGKQFKIWRSGVAETTNGKPGTVMEVTPDTITVACKEGALVLLEVQLEGKKRMSVHDFLLGNELKPGEVLGQ